MVTDDGASPTITSVANRLVREAAALAEASSRRVTGHHLAEGPRVVAEALSGAEVVHVFVRDDPAASDLPAARGDGTAPGGTAPAGSGRRVRRVAVSARVLERISTTVHPTGPVAVVVTPDVSAALPVTGPVVVLDGVADPGNVGTLVRAADAFGAAAVVVVEGADPFSPKAVRASAGSCYHLPVLVRRDRTTALAELTATRVLHGLSASGETSVLDARLPPDVALVIGNEAHGLAAATRTALAGTLTIPMPGRAESLNAATAGAVALFAVLVAGGSHGLGSRTSPEEAS